MRVGIIGAGLIGRKRAGSMPIGCHVTAVFDVHHEAGARLRDDLAPAAKVASSLQDFLTMEFDLAIVATTHASLTELALAVLQTDRHVLIEKPGASSAAQMREVVSSARERRLRARVGYNHRFHGAIMAIRRELLASDYGPLIWIRARYGHGGRLGYEKEWRSNRAVSGGGELIDQGSHLIDLTRFFVGDVDLEYAALRTLFWPMEVEDNAFLSLRPRCGGVAWLHASWTEWKNLFSLEVEFAQVKFEVSGLGGSYGRETLTKYSMRPEMGPPDAEIFEFPLDSSWAEELLDVRNDLNGELAFGATALDALKVLELIEDAYSRQIEKPAADASS